MERRLLENDTLLRLLEFSESANDKFPDEAGMRLLCQKFARYSIDEELVAHWAAIAQILLEAMKIETTLGCIEYLLPMATSFNELIEYFRLVISCPVTSA